MSTVYALVRHVRDHAHPGSKQSWLKLNATLREALGFAIRAEFNFEREDIADIYGSCYGDFWFGDSTWILASACIYGNASAASSYSKWAKVKRFAYKGVIDHQYRRGSKPLARLYPGAGFTWNGEQVKVTSFSKDGKSLIACSYREPEKMELGGRMVASGPSKVKHRYTITPKQLR